MTYRQTAQDIVEFGDRHQRFPSCTYNMKTEVLVELEQAVSNKIALHKARSEAFIASDMFSSAVVAWELTQFYVQQMKDIVTELSRR